MGHARRTVFGFRATWACPAPVRPWAVAVAFLPAQERANCWLKERACCWLCHWVGARPSDRFRAAWQASRARVLLRPALAGVAAAGGALAR
eukprot:10726569-Alexandrium_andersonii.AAC.1